MPDLNLEPFLLLPLGLVLLLMALPILRRRMHGEIDFIEPGELASRLHHKDEGLDILDIRTPAEFSGAHIAESNNTPLNEIEKSLYAKHTSNADTKCLILVCQSDMRSISMFKKMRENGNSNMKVLKGGIFAWKRAKLPTSQS